MLDLLTLNLIHVVISVVGILAGMVVVGGMLAGNRLNGWTMIFLVTTVLTSITGFFYPFTILLPSHKVGIISLIILPIAILARYGKHLEGPWRSIYVIGAVAALWFNVFVLMVQLFLRIPLLLAIAPTQKSPAFAGTQLLILAMFIVLGRAAVKGFKTA